MKYLIFSKITKDGTIPKRVNENAAGLDLYSAHNIVIPPNTRALVKTDIAWRAPKGYYGLICDRSGLALKNGATTLGGVIDSDYSGNIGVIIFNTDLINPISIETGDRIAQLVIHQYHTFPVIEEEYDKMGATERGAGGFGSTGK